MKKIIAVVCAILMLSVSVVACTASNKPAASDQTATVIKIGATGPLTGGAAIYGQACANAAQIAVDEINALGGLQFELRYEDDAHDPEKAVNAYAALKDWGAQVTLGSVTTKPALATSQLNFEDNLFAITPSASAVDVVKGKSNVFQMCFTDPNQGTASADYIASKELGTKVAIIYNNGDAYSTGIYQTFVDEAAGKNFEIVSTTTFTDETATDFSAQIADAKDNGADLVFLPIYYQPASLILKQCKDVGYAPKFFGVDGMDGILTMEGFDPTLAEGVMLLTPFNADASDEKTVNFVKKYQEKFGEIPNQFAADAYDCVYAIYQACQNGNVTADMTAEQINEVLKVQFTSMTFNGLTGENMTWDVEGMVSKEPKGMVIQNGGYVGME
ncbi:MAG: ABC transporter substrate-binding protein [Clostridia bacterium]|nr:ABC transporter substrate-binding protein [Clostridia bacterium]